MAPADGPGLVFRRRPGCVVTLEADTVRKTFTGRDAGVQLRLAEREFRHLREFRRALGGLEGATCPEAVAVVSEPVPEVRMTRERGVPLLELLRRRTLDPEALAGLGAVAAAALQRWIETFDEPYEDFQFDNMLYDGASGVVAFLDFDLPAELAGSRPAGSPLEVSLGNLIGSTVFQSARPGWVLRRRQHRQAAALSGRVVELALASAPVDIERLAGSSRAAYERLAAQGRWYRRLWFASVAPLVARRVRVGGRVLATARPFWPRTAATGKGAR
jgi:hypothetical protein